MNNAAYRLPPDLAADIEAYAQDVARYMSGALPGPVFKAKRVPRGVYEQRQDGAYMVRVRVAGGALSAVQAARLAALSREYGNGLLHVTTRQDLQLHDVAIGNTPAIMRRLLEVGLTTKGGGGNTVRNVTACPYAGVCPREWFDVTPAAGAVTESLIPLVGSYNLPRKYKIAFSGCEADCALAQVADLGFVAAARDGRPGFAVFAGGGMGAHSRVADQLFDWTPASEAVRIAEAVRRLFDRLGDRTNKHKARLRYVFEKLGAAACRDLVKQELARLADEGMPAWTGDVSLNEERSAASPGPPADRIEAGLRVVPQRQADWVSVPLRFPLGFVTADELDRSAALAARFSREGGLRATQRQHLSIRSVPRADLPALKADVAALTAGAEAAYPLERIVACAGASTCRLGLCLARDAARACAERLSRAGVSRGTLDALDIHINGCPNACGQQPIAPIGLYGAVQRVEGRLVPSYRITLGGRCGPDGARLGVPAGQISARALPEWLCDVASEFARSRAGEEPFTACFDRLGAAPFEALANRHARVPSYAEQPDYYRDFGAEADFSLAGRGAGECGAGIFELIQKDLETADNAAGVYERLLPAARALLITRGIDAPDAGTVFREFERLFVDTGLVSESFRPLLARARGCSPDRQEPLLGDAEPARGLLDRVRLLYGTLDGNLEFHPPEGTARTAPPSAAPAAPGTAGPANAELDLRGVGCPMNFVKAKLKLETMEAGQVLAVVLDDGDPVKNVPASFRNEGHIVEAVRDLKDGHWQVVIRKKG